MNNVVKPPPKLYLKKDPLLPLQGWDVHAGENLTAFQGITSYGGCLDYEVLDREYELCDIDAKKIRNLGPMINDGFPNCAYLTVTYQGFTYCLFFTIRDIKEGEKLIWNYGVAHKVKFEIAHHELNIQELEEYVKKTPLSEKFNAVKKFLSINQKDKAKDAVFLNHLAERERLSYLMETPSSMLYLLSKGLLPTQDLCKIFETNSSDLKKALFDTDHLELRKLFIQNCALIEQAIQKYSQKHKEIAEEIKNLLLAWSTELPAAVVNNVFTYFSRSFQDINSLESWVEFKKNLNSLVGLMQSLHSYSIEETDQDLFMEKTTNFFRSISVNRDQKLIAAQIYADAALKNKKLENALYEFFNELGEIFKG